MGLCSCCSFVSAGQGLRPGCFFSGFTAGVCRAQKKTTPESDGESIKVGDGVDFYCLRRARLACAFFPWVAWLVLVVRRGRLPPILVLSTARGTNSARLFFFWKTAVTGSNSRLFSRTGWVARTLKLAGPRLIPSGQEKRQAIRIYKIPGTFLERAATRWLPGVFSDKRGRSTKASELPSAGDCNATNSFRPSRTASKPLGSNPRRIVPPIKSGGDPPVTLASSWGEVPLLQGQTTAGFRRLGKRNSRGRW